MWHVDRVGSQYYGTSVHVQLPYGLEYEGSGVHSAGSQRELIWLQQCSLFLKT